MSNGNNKPSTFTVGFAIAMFSTAIGGGMYIGALAQEVETLTKAQESQQSDHDTIVALKTEQTIMKDDVSDVKADVKLILQAINRMEGHDDG